MYDGTISHLSALIMLAKCKGIDIDWEYPGMRGAGNTHRPEDKQNFTLMLESLRQALDSCEQVDQRSYLLTIASGASKRYLENTEMARAQEFLDFINVMSYDYSGAWQETTAHHANLDPSLIGQGSYMSSREVIDWNLAAR